MGNFKRGSAQEGDLLKPLKVRQMAERFGLSRSTLLYYDRIGLLQPSERTSAGYRLYSESDVRRMEKIALFREAGLALEVIQKVLASESPLAVALESRLGQIHQEMAALRRQQTVLRRLAKQGADFPPDRMLDKARWVDILRAAGLEEPDMVRWHVEFERLAPEAHHDFLESLGIDEREISGIRAWSRHGRESASG